jgi:hypothetical protein
MFKKLGHAKKITIISIFVLIGTTYHFYKEWQNTKLVGTIDCGASKIDVRLSLRPNPLEGDDASYEILYSTRAVKNIKLGGGPLIHTSGWHYPLPENTNLDISLYSTSSPSNDLVLFLPDEKMASENDAAYNFSKAEFDYLDSCLNNNIKNVNAVLAALPSSLPWGIRHRATIIADAPQLTALLHISGQQLGKLLEQAGVDYDLAFTSENKEQIIRISHSGFLRYDYYSDVGLDIFTTDFSKPLPEEFEWLNSYTSNNLPLIEYLQLVPQKVPVVFPE